MFISFNCDCLLQDFGNTVLGVMSWIIPVSVASSVVGTCLAVCFTGGRISHVAAKEGHFSTVLAMIHVKRFTPVPSVILNVSCLLLNFKNCIASLVFVKHSLTNFFAAMKNFCFAAVSSAKTVGKQQFSFAQSKKFDAKLLRQDTYSPPVLHRFIENLPAIGLRYRKNLRFLSTFTYQNCLRLAFAMVSEGSATVLLQDKLI